MIRSNMNIKEKRKLDFSQTHIRYKNKSSEPVVGVTTALNILAKPALIPWAYQRGRDGLELYESRDKAANVGTIVHARIMAYFEGSEIDNFNIAPDIWRLTNNSLESFFEWARPRKINAILVEKPLVSEKYLFGGTPDFYGEMDDQTTLLDFKSGSGLYEEHFIQLAAYSKLLDENCYPHKKIIILNIPKNEGDSFQLQQTSADKLDLHFEKFLCCVKLYYLDKQIKENKKGLIGGK